MRGSWQQASVDVQAVPFGPSTWGARQWVGLGFYILLFVLFIYLVWRLARPKVPSEVVGEQGQRPVN